jgi:hypothetical protein
MYAQVSNNIYFDAYIRSMKKRFSTIIVAFAMVILLSNCNSAKRCGCPTFGKKAVVEQPKV